MMHLVYRLQDEKNFEVYKELVHELNELLKAKEERLSAAGKSQTS